ncbi:hypothetical protein FS837_005088 [Tulasnella sp. UAMH 9824]|nr:hypothetical protein FS837_005088 [Tulasnella sp. UAMH 9824]
MDTIPIEILIHILSFSIPSRRQRKVRRLLSRVCHFWNTAIYSSPFFWTEVRLHENTEELQEILRRNSDGPLDVIWTPSNTSKAADDAGMRRTEMVSPHSQRWRSLILAGYMTSKMQALLLGVPTPRLVDLDLVVIMEDEQKLTLAKEGAQLCELTLSSRSLDVDWESSRLSGLRCLRLEQPGRTEPTVEQLHAILSSSPGLEILDLAYFYSKKQFKELGPVPLPSLTTLSVSYLQSEFLHMLLSCVQAPNCRYIQLPNISHVLFDDNHLLEKLAKLCQVPLSTVPRLFVRYDRASGSFTITHHGTEPAPGHDIRESSIKLAKRRGIYLRTRGVLYDQAVQHDTPQSNGARVRRFIKEFVQPALRNVNAQIRLDLHNWSPHMDSLSNNSLVTDLLVNVPLVTDLRMHSQFDPMDVLPFLSTWQPVRTMDRETIQESSWPIPIMKNLTVACESRNQEAVLESLNNLISKRGSRMQRGDETVYGQADERETGALPSPRYLKYIALQGGEELPSRVWDSKQGWRALSITN